MARIAVLCHARCRCRPRRQAPTRSPCFAPSGGGIVDGPRVHISARSLASPAVLLGFSSCWELYPLFRVQLGWRALDSLLPPSALSLDCLDRWRAALVSAAGICCSVVLAPLKCVYLAAPTSKPFARRFFVDAAKSSSAATSCFGVLARGLGPRSLSPSSCLTVLLRCRFPSSSSSRLASASSSSPVRCRWRYIRTLSSRIALSNAPRELSTCIARMSACAIFPSSARPCAMA